MTMRFSKLSTLLLGALTVTGCAEQQQQQAMPPAAYQMITVATGNCDFTKEASATIRGRQDITIIPQVAGRLTSVRVTEGDNVKRGQVMFVIDQVPYRAAVASAEAAVATAKATQETAALTLSSKKSLYEAKVVSEFDYLTAQNSKMVADAQLESANAALLNAKNNLSYTTVTSPADGVIGTIPYRVGSLVSTATSLTTVSDNSVMEVYFSMAENELLSVIREAGSREKALEAMPEVSLKLSDGSIYEQKGRVKTMSGVIDRTTGTITLRADFDNESGLLHSGASGNVVIPTSRESVISIPTTATYELQDKVFVFQNVDGVAKSKNISVTRAYGTNLYIVESGLAAGDKIVGEGVGLLREGTPIADKAAQPAPSAATPAAAPAAAKEDKK